ncbi:MAG: THUMP domain-containing protein [Bacteroidota bacterium]
MIEDKNNIALTARTFQGLEEVLAKELEQIGARNIAISKRAVEFEGDQKLLYTANMALRTAIKIIMPIKSFEAKDETTFYNEVKAIEWEKYLSTSSTFMVETAVKSEYFTHSQYVAYKTKDAIVDRFREKFKDRPSVNLVAPNLYVDVRISSEICVISLNSSGEPLFKRGYRKDTNEAPINEVLAAGMVLLSEWDGQSDLLDPMCGSGTILCEAAMIASNTAPNLNRNEFGFKTWFDYDPRLLMEIRKELRSKRREVTCKIRGTDIDKRVLDKAFINIENAGVDDFVILKQRDFFEHEKQDTPVFIITNPPYQERMRIEDIEEFYKKMGDTFKQKFTQATAWLISSNENAVKSIGLKASRRIPLFNGKLECRFLKYEMYEGTKKIAKESIES